MTSSKSVKLTRLSHSSFAYNSSGFLAIIVSGKQPVLVSVETYDTEPLSSSILKIGSPE